MITMHDLAGYVAALMMFLTFLTKDRCSLRILAIFANVAFLIYGTLVWLPPVLYLHALLLPINTVRLLELKFGSPFAANPNQGPRGHPSLVPQISWGHAMSFCRRQFLGLAVGVTALAIVPHIASALDYPTRPLRLIVGYPAGGPSDISARILGQSLSERLGQPVVVENRPGASSNIAAAEALRAPADGYTLLLATSANAINVTLYNKLTFDFVRDAAPVAGFLQSPNIMEVNPSVPATTVPEFIAYAKANPGRINLGSPGIGSSVHVAGALFAMMAGIDLTPVTYRGSAPALIDLVGGRVQIMFDALSSSIEYVRTGKLRGLAVTTGMRSPALPDLPSVAEFLPGYEASYWAGIVAPSKTPTEIIDKLNRAVSAALSDPKTQAQLANLGAFPLFGSPADFKKFIVAEVDKWANVIRFANITAD
jgi:tripartite-type tricarboxylate transporter receptor subunit TctC